ncbi:MAG: polyphosphate kinase 2 family protein [Gammaproteobacteria bacterium]
MPKTLTGDSLISRLLVEPGKRVQLGDEHAATTFGWEKPEAVAVLEENRKKLSDLQYKLYADGRQALLVVIQAIDAGGKDGTVHDIFTAMNPQGCVVTSFKAPTAEELKHDYLWRIHQRVPARGMVGVFNRSHYEDVLIVRVEKLVPKAVWRERYEQINEFERMLTSNSVRIIKVFLQISKGEQKKRLEDRLQDPNRQWKFSPEDLVKRRQWSEYQKAFETMLTRCSTKHAPWYVIPADRKWFRNLAVSQIVATEMGRLPLRFPEPAYDPAKIHVR